MADEGKMTDTMASLAKMDNARKARHIVAEARDILGGNGILYEYHVACHWAAWTPSIPTRAPTASTP